MLQLAHRYSQLIWLAKGRFICGTNLYLKPALAIAYKAGYIDSKDDVGQLVAILADIAFEVCWGEADLFLKMITFLHNGLDEVIDKVVPKDDPQAMITNLEELSFGNNPEIIRKVYYEQLVRALMLTITLWDPDHGMPELEDINKSLWPTTDKS